MKLKKFTKNKKQKQIVIGSIVGILVLIGGISLYRTFAMYKVEKSFDVLNGTVPDFSSGDVTLAFTVNGEKENGIPFPNKNEGFKVKDVSCENNAQASWDNETWSLTNIKNPDSQSRIKCTINFERYEEQLLKGAYPVLKEGLVPVKIDETTGKVTKADITQNWYSYQNKQWANAVILVDGATEPEAGKEIPENQIESYFVWIPKYKYKIFDMGNTYTELSDKIDETKQNKAIDIQFGLENTTDTETSCQTPNESGEDGECKVNMWMTHPAFTAFPGSKGMWVGKFETGYNQNDDTNNVTLTESWTESNAQHNDKDKTKIIIKPNVYSWRNISVGNAYKTSFDYQRKLDSHMMKNTEWGAVAYLTQSNYGTCTGNSYTEIRINNSSSYVTGVSAKDVPSSGYNEYKNYALTEPNTENDKSYVYPNSKLSSTTLNNTGIFDMSGGAWDYVMGYMSGYSTHSGLSESEDLTQANAKYFDKYTNTTDIQFDKRILGDATGDLGPFSTKSYSTSTNRINSWYEDYATLISTNIPWFKRGGRYVDGVTAGVFAFNTSNGGTSQYNGFRIVLTP